jgi:hypothetical protein
MHLQIPGSKPRADERKVAMKKLLMVLLATAVMVACSSQPTKPKEKPQPKPPEFLTGHVAAQKLFIAAHGWARDAQPFRLESEPTPESNGHDGKSAVWRSGFASALQHSLKPFAWFGVDQADGSRGVSPGVEDSYSPGNSSTTVFDIQFLKIDSDQALEVAKKHGGDKLLEKSPDLPVFYLLDWNRPNNDLVWHIVYGSNRNEPKLIVEVDATSGVFIRAQK